jgi:hypothetical protein
MKACTRLAVLLTMGIVGSSGVALRAQGVTVRVPGITFSFGDRDRQILREWYRTHNDAPEFRGDQRWQYRLEQRLQVGNTLDPDLQVWVRPLPADLAVRLSPLPRGDRYVVVGQQHVVVLDRRGVIREVYHFERFQDPDQQAVRNWYPGHRDAPVFEGRSRWNEQLEQRIQVGAELDSDLVQMSVPAPQDLVDQLPSRPGYLRYVVIGDDVVLLDRWNTVRDVVRLERQADGTMAPTK